MKLWLLLFSLLFTTNLTAAPIDVSLSSQSLLKNTLVYYDHEELSFKAVQKKKFNVIKSDYINRGFDLNTVVWLKLEFVNTSDAQIKRVLSINNPILDVVSLYTPKGVRKVGMLHVPVERVHIYPYFDLYFEGNSKQIYWLKIENHTTMLQFRVLLESEEIFHHEDLGQQNEIMLFLGIISAFLVYALLLYFYLKEVSYLYYAFYLANLLFQQMTYVGYLPLHAPSWFTHIDNQIMVPKIAIMIAASAWYAMHFLKTEGFPYIHRTYQLFIVWLLVQIPLFGTSLFYVPEVPVITGFFFIFFNTYVGIYVYIKGNIQARFFIAGWSVVVVAYLLLILDSLGLISVMYYLPHMLMWATTIEAVLLLLAFVDQLSILEKQKELLHEEFVLEYNLRERIIKNEVEEKTRELSETLQQKELLYKELHHRVKNNLQLIMSLIRLQHDHSECVEGLQQLEGRIGAIARTHELLYQQYEDGMVDMQEYVDNYTDAMDDSLQDLNIDLHSTVDATLPLREAVYVGLIINELVSNAVKHAYTPEGGKLYLRLREEDHHYRLEVCDEGKGYNNRDIKNHTFGLSLVETLVEEQLDGSIEVDLSEGVHYIIRFEV